MDKSGESDCFPRQGELFAQGSQTVYKSDQSQPAGNADTVQTKTSLMTNDDAGVVVTNRNTMSYRDIKLIKK